MKVCRRRYVTVSKRLFKLRQWESAGPKRERHLQPLVTECHVVYQQVQWCRKGGGGVSDPQLIHAPMKLTLRPDSHYSDKAATRISTKTEEENNFLKIRKKQKQQKCNFWLHESDKPRHFLDISVLFCPVHVEWTAAVNCLYRVSHRSFYTTRNMLNIEGQVTFMSPSKMGHFRENNGTIIATAGFSFIGPGTDCSCRSWHGIPPNIQTK